MADAAAKTVSARPEAELVPREQDELLRSDELPLLDLFGNLKKKLSVEKFPGSIVLRRFQKGEVICRQGDPGQSAFYIVRYADLHALREFRARKGQEQRPADAEPPLPNGAGSEPRRVATAHLLGAARAPAAPRGLLRRLWSPRAADPASPAYIPNDGPADIDSRSRQAPMFEGDVFGEMSCMTLAPRSATVVADEDCYMVEFLRNIFDQMQRDNGYRERIDQVYAQRVLTNHLSRLEFFRDLNEEQLGVLRDAAGLEMVDPGTIICGEGDDSDSVYVIRSGVVQVVRGADVTLKPDDIADWPGFCRAILAGEPQAGAAATGDQPPLPASSGELLAKAAGKPSPADILAAARSKSTAKPAKPGMSTAEILAAAVAKGNEGGEQPRPASGPAPPARQEGDSDPSAWLVKAPKPCGDPRRAVWAWLAPPVQAAVRSLANGDSPTDANRRMVLGALNRLIRQREFLAASDLAPALELPEVIDTVASFPHGVQGVKKYWSELEIRTAGCLVLRALYPDGLKRQRIRKGPPEILAYLTRGDCFGEMGLLLGTPRQATCIAYDHPHDDPRRKPGRVELVRIDGAAFGKLLETSAGLKASLDQLVAQRQQGLAASKERTPWESRHSFTETEEFRDAGLIQGQQLLLIDLDLCTRCGDCVRACVNTHDDGYSRLFLDGPRFDRFLVPSACRQCLDPACMIGCPVGSIQRGDNGEIEIRDWCIGCTLCARQCPYDSIQMHDLGIIPEQAAGWFFAPASAVEGKAWQTAGYRQRGWSAGMTPLRWTLDLFEQLAAQADQVAWKANAGRLPEPICFRHSFDVSRDQWDHDQFRLILTAEGLKAEAWLNGRPLELQQDAKRAGRGEYEAYVERSRLRRGGNLLAVQVQPPQQSGGECYAPKYHQPLLAVRLDPVPRAGALTTATAGEGFRLEIELVTQRAVVCDLCSSLPNQEPACVSQCPHNAAIRVNARYEFPTA